MAVGATTGSGGLDVETLVSQLMALEKRPLTTLDKKIAKNTSSAQYLSSFKATVKTFEASLAALRDSSRIAGFTASSSDAAAVTATASSGAAVSDIDVKVVKTAQADRVAFSGFTSATDLTGSGTFTLNVGAKHVDITLDGSSTVTDLVSKINLAASSASVPLKASLVQTATGAWSMVVAGTETGAANTISSSSTISNANLAASVIPPLQSARDAVVIVDGIQVTSASNKIDNVVPGVLLQLRKPANYSTPADAASVQISVAANSADIHTLANTVVTSFNAMQDYYTSLTKTSIDPSARGPMSGDSSLAAMMSQTRSMLASGMTDASGNTLRFADMGVELKSDGHLTLNETNFTTAMTNGLAAKLSAGVTIPLDTYLGKMVLSTGDLGAKEANLTTAKASLQKTRDDLSDRLTIVEASLRTRYSSLDATLYRLNNINTSLTSSLKALSNNNNGN